MNLTSLHYAKLIKWLAWHSNRVLVNKTQLQKLLFICYGLSLAHEGNALFEDDTPKAFPFGPVFPISFKRYTPEVVELTEAEKDAFAQKPDILKAIVKTVNALCRVSASDFTRWSHLPGSPWYKAIYGNGAMRWGGEISRSDIKEYFKSDWEAGLMQ